MKRVHGRAVGDLVRRRLALRSLLLLLLSTSMQTGASEVIRPQAVSEAPIGEAQ